MQGIEDQQAYAERSWPEDWANDDDNGRYQNRCHRCNLLFEGHKRRITCKKCAGASQAATRTASAKNALPVPSQFSGHVKVEPGVRRTALEEAAVTKAAQALMRTECDSTEEFENDWQKPYARDKATQHARTAVQAYLNAAFAEQAAPPGAEPTRPDGWLYLNPETGVEWSAQHPVDSGEVPDAQDVRAATATVLRDELASAWDDLKEARQEVEKLRAAGVVLAAAPNPPVAEGAGVKALETEIRGDAETPFERVPVWPEKLTETLAEALGKPNFWCGPIAQLFRVTGEDIPRKSEAEQAFVLHWLAGLALKHGDEWPNVAAAHLEVLHGQLASKDNATAADGGTPR